MFHCVLSAFWRTDQTRYGNPCPNSVAMFHQISAVSRDFSNCWRLWFIYPYLLHSNVCKYLSDFRNSAVPDIWKFIEKATCFKQCVIPHHIKYHTFHDEWAVNVGSQCPCFCWAWSYRYGKMLNSSLIFVVHSSQNDSCGLFIIVMFTEQQICVVSILE